jgi:hypothetical protein
MIDHRNATATDSTELRDRGLDRRLIQRLHHRAGIVDALPDRQPQVARHEIRRRRQLDVVTIRLEAVAQVNDVAEARCAQQCRLRPVALDHRVGRNRLPVHEQVQAPEEVAEREAGLLGQRVHPALHRRRRIARRRRLLPQRDAALGVQ